MELLSQVNSEKNNTALDRKVVWTSSQWDKVDFEGGKMQSEGNSPGESNDHLKRHIW